MLTPPPATFNGGAVPEADWREFSEFGQANDEYLPLFKNAALKLGATSISLSLIDGIASGYDDFVSNPALPTPPLPTSVTTWTIYGYMTINGVTYLVDEWVGDLDFRKTHPDTFDEEAPGFGPNLTFALVASEGLATARWSN